MPSAATGSGAVVGVVVGAVNGILIAYVGLPSLAVTIGTLALYRGLALVVIGDNAVANFPTELTKLASAKLGTTGIPMIMVPVVVVVVVFGLLLHKTAFGRGLYAIGVTDAVPETIEASLQLSEAALVGLGVPTGPVIASIHEKRSELRALIREEGELAEEPMLGRRRLRDRLS